MSHILQGKTALVTGAAGGIGQAVAWALAEAGADVAPHDLSISPGLSSLATRIERMGRRAETSDWVGAKLAASVLKRFGRPEEIAGTIVFLASDAASLYIGQTLSPNGGGVMS